MSLFHFVDLDGDGTITMEEWLSAFQEIDTNGDRCVTRKEWCVKKGSTHMFDRISKKVSVRMTLDEWRQAFERLDVNNDGSISIHEWLQAEQAEDMDWNAGPMQLDIGDYVESMYPNGRFRRATVVNILGPDSYLLAWSFGDSSEKERTKTRAEIIVVNKARHKCPWMHSIQKRVAVDTNVTCDECEQPIPQWEAILSCLPCSYDRCFPCTLSQLDNRFAAYLKAPIEEEDEEGEPAIAKAPTEDEGLPKVGRAPTESSLDDILLQGDISFNKIDHNSDGVIAFQEWRQFGPNKLYGSNSRLGC